MNIRVGRISRLFAPGYSWCEHCGTNWFFVKEHIIYGCNSWGYFALCKKCNKEADLNTKNNYFKIARRKHWPYMTPTEFNELLRAVEKDHNQIKNYP